MRYLKKLLEPYMSEEELRLVTSSFDIIGDIAIIRIPEALEKKKLLIAKVLLDALPQVRTVLRQTGAVSGEHRTRPLEFLLGEDKRITTHREYGCSFLVDVEAVYFSPRLSTERRRIADLVEEGETIVNMFAGIGSYSILIAKLRPSTTIYNIDINPKAHQLAIKNIMLNKVEGRVIPLLGDAAEVIERELRGVADRVLMPLPNAEPTYFLAAVKALKAGKGMVHYYAVEEEGVDLMGRGKERIGSIWEGPFEVLQARRVGEIAPRRIRVVYDVKVDRSN